MRPARARRLAVACVACRFGQQSVIRRRPLAHLNAMSEQTLIPVVVAACPSYEEATVEVAVDEVFDLLGGIGRFVRPGCTVLIKPNLLSAYAPAAAVTTHPMLVHELVDRCEAAGAGRIWVGDSPAGEHAEEHLWEVTGLRDALAGTRAQLKSWSGPKQTVPCGPDLLVIPAWFSEVEVLISLPKLKTHSLTTLTCGIKNVFGIVAGQAKAMSHARHPSPRAMSDFLVEVFGTLRPHLTIADAVVVMEGDGPTAGNVRPLGVLLASGDAVALDAVACEVLGLKPEQVRMVRRAGERGYGAADRRRLQVTGSGTALLAETRLKPSLARYLRFIPERAFNIGARLLRLRPRVVAAACVKCGICAGICPRSAIAMEPGFGLPVVDPRRCIVCFCCVECCPRKAMALQSFITPVIRFLKRVRALLKRTRHP